MADITAEPKVAAMARGAKDEVRALLERLPEDVTLEQILYHLDVVVKVLEAEQSLARGDVVSQTEFEQRFARWLTK
jgi:hypothetical protein